MTAPNPKRRFAYRQCGDEHMERQLRHRRMLEKLRLARPDLVEVVVRLLADGADEYAIADLLRALRAKRRRSDSDAAYKRNAVAWCRYWAKKLKAANGGVLPDGTYRRLAAAYMRADESDGTDCADWWPVFEKNPVEQWSEVERADARSAMLDGLVMALQHGPDKRRGRHDKG